MISLNFKVHIDEPSVTKLLNSLSQEQRNNFMVDDIVWKVGETYSQNNETYMPIYAIGIKGKTTLQQDSLILDDYLSNAQINIYCPEPKEISSDPVINGTPIL